MRILMIAPQPFLEPRGTPISVWQRAKGLGELGHCVDLVTYPIGEDVLIPGVTLHRAPRPPFINRVKIGPSWAKLVLDLLLLMQVVKLLITRRYDVIHSHEEGSFIAALVAHFFGARHLYDMHSCLPQQLRNYDFAAYRPVIALFRLLEKWVIDSCDAVITTGTDLEQYVRGIRETVPLVTIENLPVAAKSDVESDTVIRLREKIAREGRFPVLYTGNFERYQGIELLVDSAQNVVKAHPEVLILLVGGKPEQVAQWQQRVREQALEEHVLFLGTVPVPEVSRYIDIAEVLISPRTDGTSVPLKIYSYMHSGKPILATDISAHTLVLNEESALLVAPETVAIAAGLNALIQYPMLREQLGQQARHVAQTRHNSGGYLARLEQVYQSLQRQPFTVKEPSRFQG